MSTFSCTIVTDKANTVLLYPTHDVTVTFKLLHIVHYNLWTAATTPTSFPDVDHFRTRLKRQHMVFSETNHVLKRVTAILCHLPKFNPGGSPEVYGIIMGSCGRFWKKLWMNLCFIEEEEEVRVSLRFGNLRVKLQMSYVKKKTRCFIASDTTRNVVFRVKAFIVPKTAPYYDGLLVPNDTVRDLVIGLVGAPLGELGVTVTNWATIYLDVFRGQLDQMQHWANWATIEIIN
ncbi:hypothetical protein Ddye_009405 [Dipteronia dyeriana]|uniref:Uncharacterized protein n=1 Tax=Dipteronia dyeriana TaxID=168575 RepID=A0AAE0CMV1_9ROSI|nr:hypothetical protein Ddye_009405 [Dipteronia dyeriana]